MSYQNKVQFQGVPPSNLYDFHSFHSETPITKTGIFRLAEFYVKWIFGWKITQTESSNGGVWWVFPQSSRTHPRETKRKPWNFAKPLKFGNEGGILTTRSTRGWVELHLFLFKDWLFDTNFLLANSPKVKPLGLQSKCMKKWLGCTQNSFWMLNAFTSHTKDGWCNRTACLTCA